MPEGRQSFESYFRLPVTLGRLFLVLGDIGQWPSQGSPRLLVRKENERLTISFDDLTRASVHFRTIGEFTELAIRHELCIDDQQVERWKAYWQALVTDLNERLAG
ncbi:MAG: hypothetical protein ACKOOD_03215 [Microbacteriaceae bacterium]